jgi:hypothetical protein
VICLVRCLSRGLVPHASVAFLSSAGQAVVSDLLACSSSRSGSRAPSVPVSCKRAGLRIGQISFSLPFFFCSAHHETSPFFVLGLQLSGTHPTGSHASAQASIAGQVFLVPMGPLGSGRAQHRPKLLVLMGAPSGVIGACHLCRSGWIPLL